MVKSASASTHHRRETLGVRLERLQYLAGAEGLRIVIETSTHYVRQRTDHVLIYTEHTLHTPTSLLVTVL